ncbi:MAG: hypothetical protein A3E01_10110 [Gammaproteobacteria bacterium RIFCSPHIGHO2_12_FULL_63_22]|nr:MAG: hypothetical protein A3E01_10110 [Gammaproteobacteria bacterium RIFCSPHIGHO2_12_FULL_63_22]
MGDKSKIEWTDATWNPVTGCTHVSEGCRNCYAERVLPRTGQSFDKVVCHPDRLNAPLHWRKPRRIFVNSLSDLFHEDVPDEFIAKVFLTMLSAKRHTFQILTKRPQRMLELLEKPSSAFPLAMMVGDTLPNVWLGISCEDQQTADERIPLLLQTPAAVRFISAEPLLGKIDLSVIGGKSAVAYRMVRLEPRRLDWVIVGGESGPHARPMHPNWARRLRDQCQAAGVPFFFKQWGEWAEDPMLDCGRGDKSHSRQVASGGLCNSIWMTRFGKKAAGRILDGRTWDEMPKAPICDAQ